MIPFATKNKLNQNTTNTLLDNSPKTFGYIHKLQGMDIEDLCYLIVRLDTQDPVPTYAENDDMATKQAAIDFLFQHLITIIGFGWDAYDEETGQYVGITYQTVTSIGETCDDSGYPLQINQGMSGDWFTTLEDVTNKEGEVISLENDSQVYTHKVTCTGLGGDLYYKSLSNKTYSGTDVVEWFSTVYKSGINFFNYVYNSGSYQEVYKYRSAHNIFIYTDGEGATSVKCYVCYPTSGEEALEEEKTITSITSDELVE